MGLDYWLSHRYTNGSVPDDREEYWYYLGLRDVDDRNLAKIGKGVRGTRTVTALAKTVWSILGRGTSCYNY